jgi:hypothetical protein
MKGRRWLLLLCGFAGMVAALFWHFIHAAGEPDYTPFLNDPHFWLHLLAEGIIALYVALFLYALVIIAGRMKRKN